MTKPLYKSETLIGLGVMILGLIVARFNLPIAQTEITPIVSFLFEAIGGVMVFHGRMTAKDELVLK